MCSIPLLTGWYSQKKTQNVLATYEQVVEQTTGDEIEQLRNQADEYNKKLWAESKGVREQSESEQMEEYEGLLNAEKIQTGMMCVLEIPSIDLRLPVYHGTSEAVLKEGVGHLMDSSLPIGGENTHCVMTGHRGLASARLFTRLDELKEGDEFFLEVLGEKLAYKVEEINVILPEEVESLEIRPGEDLVSLVTCTPYGINTHRLVITGKRVVYEEKKEEEIKKKRPSVREMIFTMIPILFLVYVVIERIKRKREKRNCEGKRKRNRNQKRKCKHYRRKKRKRRKAGDKKERCKRRQNGKIKCGILLLLICFLVVAVKNPAFAETETGNIEICIEDTGEQIKREGVTFQYSKVSSLVDGAYEMEKRYEDKGVDLNEVRYAREQEELARTLSKYHYSDGLCRTDCDGKATLTNLRAGVYLIYVEDESEYEVQPVLVQLPKWEEDKGAMNWNVRVCPKQTIREEAAKTGDSQQAGAWAMLCLGAGILILLLAVKKD